MYCTSKQWSWFWRDMLFSILVYSVWHIPSRRLFFKSNKTRRKLHPNRLLHYWCAPTECHKNITIRVNAITYFAPRQIPLNEISSCGLSTMNEWTFWIWPSTWNAPNYLNYFCAKFWETTILIIIILKKCMKMIQ